MPELHHFRELSDRASFIPNAEMRHYTSFRLGGKCPVLVECPTAEVLGAVVRKLVELKERFILIGEGTNLLVSDSGPSAAVLRYCAKKTPPVQVEGDEMIVGGQMLLDDLVQAAIGEKLGDLSFCSGIPGTVGGAIAGNAGAFGRQIGDLLVSVDLLEPDGHRHVAKAGDLQLAYRNSILKKSRGMVLGARLRLAPANHEPLLERRREILALRRRKHPEWRVTPCAGSVFRNVEPSSSVGRRKAAGWFLEQAGAMDFRIGNARLFERHANIITAGPGATAQDVYLLSEKMKRAVQEKFGIELVFEVKMLGEFRLPGRAL